MQIKKSDIRINIINIGKQLFLENEFSKTSMKKIAIDANLSTSNIYTYFKNKEDLLNEIVKLAVRAYQNFLKETSTDEIWQDTNSWTVESEIKVFEKYIDMIYLYKDEFIILFLKSRNSKYENFYNEVLNSHFLTSQKVNEMSIDGNFNYLKRDVPNYIIKNIVKMYMNILVEGLEENISKKEMNKRMKECAEFLFKGYEIYFTDEIKNKR